MIRVLSIIHHTEFSGPTNRNIKIIPFLEKKSIEVYVLVPDKPLASAFHKLNENNINTITTRFHRLRSTRDVKEQIRFITNFFGDIQRISNIIQEKKIDIVQLNGFMNPHGAIAARLKKRRVVWQLIDTRSPKLLMYMIMPLLILFSHGGKISICSFSRG